MVCISLLNWCAGKREKIVIVRKLYFGFRLQRTLYECIYSYFPAQTENSNVSSRLTRTRSPSSDTIICYYTIYYYYNTTTATNIYTAVDSLVVFKINYTEKEERHSLFAEHYINVWVSLVVVYIMRVLKHVLRILYTSHSVMRI